MILRDIFGSIDCIRATYKWKYVKVNKYCLSPVEIISGLLFGLAALAVVFPLDTSQGPVKEIFL